MLKRVKFVLERGRLQNPLRDNNQIPWARVELK
jgi:hypothetical protein